MRTRHKTLIIAMSTALLTTPALYAQVRGPGNAASGPSTSAPLGPGGLPGDLCSGGSGASGPTGITGATDDPAGISGSTCSGPIGGSTLTSQFELQGCEGIIVDANVGLDISHTWVGDLIITLTSPANTSVTIMDRPGVPEISSDGCTGDNVFATLDDSAATPVEDECAGGVPTISGTFQPNNPLSSFVGEAGNGTWVLQVSDGFPSEDDGTLNDWSLDLTCGEGEPRAAFEVNKVFTDGNPGEVDVTLNCFTGLPLTQSQSITEDQNVVFVVTDYDDGELDCEVVEEGVTGYSAEYNNGLTTDDESCAYDDVGFSASRTCTITNTPIPQEVEVHKDWVIEGSGGDELSGGYKLKLYCDNEIVDGYGSYSNWSKTIYSSYHGDLGDTSHFAQVVPDWDGGTHCWVEEDVFDSAVEVDNDCGDLLVELGSGDSCTITNTVFYEGIPTLSNYGLALLALMMMGVGFVGFRRFA